ncbi:hypothetical protein A2V82_03275 [candidate division KSB1 bacterium RBG_16_48_16]|nr:MAG: hypothetical protein A2V82_03275 [candidate division KSB1 bacterium RBG_16_48_16]
MFVAINKTPHVQSHRDWMLMTVKLFTILLGPSQFLQHPVPSGTEAFNLLVATNIMSLKGPAARKWVDHKKVLV